jgi:hydroxypyruvate reductase
MTLNKSSTPIAKSTEAILKNAFAAAVAVADPQVIVPQYLAQIFPRT